MWLSPPLPWASNLVLCLELNCGWEQLLLEITSMQDCKPFLPLPFLPSFLPLSLTSIKNFIQMASTLLGTTGESIETSEHTHSLAMRNLPSGWEDKTWTGNI